MEDHSSVHLLQDGETIETIDEQVDLIHWYGAAPNRRMLVAEVEGGELAGQVTAFGGTYSADQGTAVLIIEVAPAWRWKGIGTQLMEAIETWAREQRLHRLELTVLSGNQPALRLYEKCGFVSEGRKRASRRINQHFYDEIVMAKLLPPF